MTYEFKNHLLGERYKRIAGRLKGYRCFVIDWDNHNNVIIYYPRTDEWGKYNYDKFCEEFQMSPHRAKLPNHVRIKIGKLLNGPSEEFKAFFHDKPKDNFPTEEFQQFATAAFGHNWEARRRQTQHGIRCLRLKLYVCGELRATREYNPKTKMRLA